MFYLVGANHCHIHCYNKFLCNWVELYLSFLICNNATIRGILPLSCSTSRYLGETYTAIVTCASLFL